MQPGGDVSGKEPPPPVMEPLIPGADTDSSGEALPTKIVPLFKSISIVALMATTSKSFSTEKETSLVPPD